MKNTIKNNIILASSSPRRKELLEALDIDFKIIPADIDESINLNNNLALEIENLAYKKAKAVFDSNKDSLVIGADTIVTINNKVLGKPIDKKDAYRMLKLLSANKHKVITGVCLINKDYKEIFHNETIVEFYQLTDQEINDYINTDEPMDKAGAYGIQGYGRKFIKKIDGDFFTVMGLPIGEVYQRLKKFLPI